MSRSTVVAAILTVLGLLITLINLRNGLQFSFALLLGLLLFVDGAIRFALISQERAEPSDTA